MIICKGNNITVTLCFSDHYTFRAVPSRVEVLQQLGADIVSLANNHVYDYGEEALLDTMDTLEQAQIPYVGAGRNLEEAEKIVSNSASSP